MIFSLRHMYLHISICISSWPFSYVHIAWLTYSHIFHKTWEGVRSPKITETSADFRGHLTLRINCHWTLLDPIANENMGWTKRNVSCSVSSPFSSRLFSVSLLLQKFLFLKWQKHPQLNRSVSSNKHCPPPELRGFPPLLKVIVQRMAVIRLFLEVFMSRARLCLG